MEFKLIFVGFALHCVLNTVLICKSVITNSQQERREIVHVAEEEEMLRAFNDSPEEMKRMGGDFEVSRRD